MEFGRMVSVVDTKALVAWSFQRATESSSRVIPLALLKMLTETGGGNGPLDELPVNVVWETRSCDFGDEKRLGRKTSGDDDNFDDDDD